MLFFHILMIMYMKQESNMQESWTDLTCSLETMAKDSSYLFLKLRKIMDTYRKLGIYMTILVAIKIGGKDKKLAYLDGTTQHMS